MYKSILIPIDLGHTDKGKRAIETARKLSDKDTKIHLVTVVEDVPAFISAQLPTGIIEKTKNDASDALKAIANAAVLKADTEVRSGNARSAILATAEECGADLIIVGSHKPGMTDYLLGSTASHVVRHAACSVQVVR